MYISLYSCYMFRPIFWLSSGICLYYTTVHIFTTIVYTLYTLYCLYTPHIDINNSSEDMYSCIIQTYAWWWPRNRPKHVARIWTNIHYLVVLDYIYTISLLKYIYFFSVCVLRISEQEKKLNMMGDSSELFYPFTRVTCSSDQRWSLGKCRNIL
jgi:hypothetical protein